MRLLHSSWNKVLTYRTNGWFYILQVGYQQLYSDLGQFCTAFQQQLLVFYPWRPILLAPGSQQQHWTIGTVGMRSATVQSLSNICLPQRHLANLYRVYPFYFQKLPIDVMMLWRYCSIHRCLYILDNTGRATIGWRRNLPRLVRLRPYRTVPRHVPLHRYST